jgi:YesN/AraC family two-component response regulator
LNKKYLSKITSKDIEDYTGYDYDYLNRLFVKITGYTILNYLNVLRINKAKEFIRTTKMKFNQISYLVGIEDQYYFSKLFKKISGMTPTKYSDIVKNDPDYYEKEPKFSHPGSTDYICDDSSECKLNDNANM